MAINRFDRRQGIQFNPMDFSAMAAAPIAMQQRYDQTQNKMGIEFDKMATIENTGDELADATIKRHKDNLAAYADRLSQEGYSPGMTDEFMQIKRGYTGDLNSIAAWKQDAMKQNSLLDQAKLDPSNVIVGSPNLGYDAYGTEAFGINSSVHNQNNYYSRGKDAGVAMAKTMSSGEVDKIPGLTGYLNYVKKPQFESKQDVYGYLRGAGKGMVESLMQTMSNDPNVLQNDQLRSSIVEGIASSAVGTQKSQLVRDEVSLQNMKNKAAWDTKYNDTQSKSSGPISSRAMNTITRNKKLFKNAGDAIDGLFSEDNSLRKSASHNLASKAMSMLNISDNYSSRLLGGDADPKEFLNNINSEKARINAERRDVANEVSKLSILESQGQGSGALTEAELHRDQLDNELKELNGYEKTLKGNMETLMETEDNDLNTPVYRISPSTKDYTQRTNIVNDYMSGMGLVKFDFQAGPLAGKEGRSLERQDEHGLLEEDGFEVVGMGAERDSGVFYMIRDSEGNIHTVTQRDPGAQFDNEMAGMFGRPELMNIHQYKDYSIVGSDMFKNGEKIDDLQFNVSEVDDNGYRAYQIDGVSNGEFYDQFIELEKQQLMKNPQIATYASDQELEEMARESLGIPNDLTWWKSPYQTTSKELIKKYNDMLKEAPKK